MSTRVLFVNAIDVTSNIETVAPALGLAYLASALRKEFGPNQFEFKIVDQNVEPQIRTFDPDIVGISAVSQNYNRAIEYARTAKRFDLPVIVGGVHISELPSTLTEDMDVGVIGEGERTIIDLFKLFLDEGHLDKKRLASIQGVAFRSAGNVVVTEKRPLIEPLDSLATPARDLLEAKKCTYMFTTRGCPYDCAFCASCRFWGKVRFFSADYVANEIKLLVRKYKVDQIALLDDLFVANKARIRRICDLLKQEGILGTVTFACNARSNRVTDELAELLKEMNVKTVGMGLESASPKTLEYLKGKSISVEDHVHALATLRKYGIKPHASFIIGSPEESEEDILRTLSFVEENDLCHFDLYVLTPFPGTPVWEYARSRGLVSEDMNWDVLNVNFESNAHKAIILSERLTRAEICRLFSMFSKAKKRMKKKARMRRTWKHAGALWAAVANHWSGRPLKER